MKYDTEEEYVNDLHKRLDKNGYVVWREVIPDKCLKWSNPWAVDLVLWSEHTGYIGVEGKNLNSIRQGSIYSEAIKQVLRYRDETYNGIKIDKWCVAAPTNLTFETSEKEKMMFEISHFIKHFLKSMYNISTIDDLYIDTLSKNKIDLSFNVKKTKAPVELITKYNIPFIENFEFRCFECGASLDVEDEVCPYCGLKKEGGFDD
jgi:hypothetical protein